METAGLQPAATLSVERGANGNRRGRRGGGGEAYVLPRLDERRRELGVSMRALAQRAGISTSTLGRILRREHRAGTHVQIALARALVADASELFEPPVRPAREMQLRRAAQLFGRGVRNFEVAAALSVSPS